MTAAVIAALLLWTLREQIVGLYTTDAAVAAVALSLLGVAAVFSILFISKFVVLEIIDLIFGERVSLGGFIQVALLVITMILARRSVTWAYRRLGDPVQPSTP